MLKRNNIIKCGQTLFWFITLFSYFFQCPFSFLSRLIVPSLFVFILLEYKNFHLKRYRFRKILYVYVTYISILLALSILKGNIITWAFRFYMILLAIPICFAIKDPNFDIEEKILFRLAIVKSIMLIGIYIGVVLLKDFTPFQLWARIHSYGDVYISHGFIKVQLHGNALLVVAFMLNYMKKKRLSCSNIVLLLGVLAAGNFAFILGIAGFIVFRGIKVIATKGTKTLEKAVIVVIGVIGLLVMIPFINNQIIWKSAFSNRIRIEQAKILLDDNLLVGNGLGNKIIVEEPELIERFSNYTYYYELQTLYIFNQIGFVGLFLFYVITLWAAYKNGLDCFWIYLLYLFYSFWNPYCFDTTHMIAIIAMINLKEMSYGKKNCNYNGVLSYRRKCVGN